MLILLSSFYLIYFVKQISLKKRGINTNRLAKGTKPKRTRLIETCLLFVTYATAAVQYLSVFVSTKMGKAELPAFVNAIGIFITLSGVVFFAFAILAMRDNWRAGIDKTQKTNIVSNGIYRYSRNPAFVGFDLLYIGTALTFTNILIIIFTVIAVIFLHLQILEEEKYLALEFGEVYTNYRSKTARYLLF